LHLSIFAFIHAKVVSTGKYVKNLNHKIDLIHLFYSLDVYILSRAPSKQITMIILFKIIFSESAEQAVICAYPYLLFFYPLRVSVFIDILRIHILI